MNYPKELFYTKDHEWLRLEGDIATVGITDYAQSELGEIVFVDVPTVGDEVDTHAVFGSIEAVKTVSDLFMPLAGEVTELNEELDAHPELVNEDPYGAGWLIKIKLKQPDDVSTLLSSEQYREWTGKA